MDKTIIILTCLVYAFTSYCYGSELFTSTDALRSVSKAEDMVIPELGHVLNAVQERINLLKIILHDIKFTQKVIGSNDDLIVAGHPIHAYNLVKRWRHIESIFAEGGKARKSRLSKKSIPKLYGCQDMNPECTYWAERGECDKNPDYMKSKCKLSCKICEVPKAEDPAQTQLHAVNTKIYNITQRELPLEDDYVGSAKGIIRLQRTYKLKTDDIKAGKVKGFKASKGLSADDCYNLGQTAVQMNEWGYGAQWLKKALASPTCTVPKSEIYHELAKAYIQMRDYDKANESIQLAYGGYSTESTEGCADRHKKCPQWAKLNECVNNPGFMNIYCVYSCKRCHLVAADRFPGEHKVSNLNVRLQKLIQETNSGKTKRSVREPNTIRIHQTVARTNYEKLCRGEGIRHYNKAVCRYRPAGLAWNVYQEEILSMNPRIALVYNVISDNEAELLQYKARSLMEHATVGPTRAKSDIRVSKVGWLGDDDPFVMKLSERVELITGLEATHTRNESNIELISSDKFQTVNYGIGGQYEPHTDYFQGSLQLDKTDIGKLIRNSGDRIATFLLYLSDIKAGGSTVYPKVRIRVPPVKNAAAFWYNSRMSGDYDPLTMHAGCPVLLGEKWVCNKWFREYGNEFKRKCSLNRNAEYS